MALFKWKKGKNVVAQRIDKEIARKGGLLGLRAKFLVRATEMAIFMKDGEIKEEVKQGGTYPVPKFFGEAE